MKSFKIGTLNVRGLCNHKTRRKTFQWLNDLKFDIVFLQETYCKKDFVSIFDNSWKGKIIHCVTDSSHSRGVCVMFKENLKFEVINHRCSTDGRILLVNIKIFDQIYCLTNIYAPNSEFERRKFFVDVQKWLEDNCLNFSNIIIAGDFNCCILDCDRQPQTHLKDSSRKVIKSILNQLKLKDAWCYSNNNCERFTYIDKQYNTKSRLDCIFVSENTTVEATNVVIPFDTNVIDHNLVCCQVKYKEHLRGPNYWKFNSQYLSDKQYCVHIEKLISNSLENHSTSMTFQQIWETLKIEIREFTIAYGSNKSKSQKSEINYLQDRINQLNLDINKENLESSLELADLTSKLNALLEIESHGAFIRSKSEWCQKGEKCSRFFLSLESQRQCNNAIKTLKTEKGTIVKNETEILKEIANYYENLFSAKTKKLNTDINAYLSSVELTDRLSDKDQIFCDKNISEYEIETAISKLHIGKSPGLDGLTPEFYKHFWTSLKRPFCNMLNETFSKGQLPDSLKTAVVTLLYKKDSKEMLKNYRPISLTNYDYKILAFVLSARIQKIIHKLISRNQTAYIKSRFIGNNVRLVADLIDYSETFSVPGIMLSLDFEKAFDTINWEFMFKCLEKFNFGPSFIKWVRILYSDPNMVVKNNGFISKAIRLERGLRQGCPLSAILFILCVEILALKLNCNKKIRGFSFKNTELKISQYADDSTLLLNDFVSFEEALKVVSNFSDIAGPKLNLAKSEGLLLGPLKELNIKTFCNVKFSDKPIKYLGIYIGHNKDECSRLNWDTKLSKIEEIIKMWGKRNLTLFGKTTVINVLCIPKIIYNCMLLPVPEVIIAKIEKMISQFLWHRRNRINRNCIINDIENGGLNIVDIRTKISSLKAGWVNRWLNDPPWTTVANTYLEKIGCNFQLLLSMNIKNINDLPVLKLLPSFYQEVWLAYYSSKTCKTLNTMTNFDFFTSPIWGNDLFKFQNKCLFFKSWISCDILYVKDVFDETGKFFSEAYFLDRIKDKRNWVTEYTVVKKIILSKCKTFNTTQARYIKMPNPMKMLFYNGKSFVDLKTEKSSMYYKILLKQKVTRHYMEKVWQTKFKRIHSIADWKNIYVRKIKSIPCTKLREFNYKLIHNLIYPGYILNKWKPSVSRNCSYCSKLETTEHLLFECSRVEMMWKTIGEAIQVDLKFYHVIIGLDETYAEVTNKAKNTLITVICYSIFVSWIRCGDSKERYKYINLWNNMKISLNYYKKIFSNFLSGERWFKKYSTLVHNLNSITD